MKEKIKKACVIWNPSAGNMRRNEKNIELAMDFFKHKGYEIEKKATAGPFTATQIAHDAAQSGAKYIFAIGGDGTINEVLNGMHNTDSILGIIPVGTANLLARQIRIPTNIIKALKSLDEVDIHEVNLGKANERYFILMTGIGFDGHIISKIAPHFKSKYGKLAFAYHATIESFLYDYPCFTLRINGREITSAFAIVALSKEYAGLFSLTPEAHLTRDQFQVCIFHNKGSLIFWKYFISALLRTHHRLNDVTLEYASSLEIYSDKKVWSQIDGELFSQLPLQISIVPKGLKLLIPRYAKQFSSNNKNSNQ